MKRIIKRVIPNNAWRILKSTREVITLISCFKYDLSRFYHFYGGLNRHNQSTIASWLLQDCHRIEKGLSLAEFRFGFGKDVISRIIFNYEILDKKNEFGKSIENITKNALNSYHQVHISNGEKHPFYNDDRFNNIIVDFSDFNHSRNINVESNNGFRALLNSRMSIRAFSDQKVGNELLDEAISMAALSPSVCNRQHWRVHRFDGKDMEAILKLQNGNGSFRKHIHQILVVTSDLGYFVTPMERYQQYIDGGIFSANLLNALQDLGVYSCALNWSSKPMLDKKLHCLKLFPEQESVIMIIAYGYPLNAGVNACLSKRLDSEAILTIN